MSTHLSLILVHVPMCKSSVCVSIYVSAFTQQTISFSDTIFQLDCAHCDMKMAALALTVKIAKCCLLSLQRCVTCKKRK